MVAFVAQLPWEMTAVLAALRACAEVAALLGSLTLGLQLIVLGASLLPPRSAPPADASARRASPSGAREPRPADDGSSSGWVTSGACWHLGTAGSLVS